MEVQTNSHLFQTRFNDERTKKATISTEIAMRITKIAKLKHRYESFAITLNTGNSNEENVLAQAQYVIKVTIKQDICVLLPLSNGVYIIKFYGAQ